MDISGKVDKVTGRGLSTNDYSDAEKQKVVDTAEGLGTHLVDKTNPHSTTKSQIGLGNVDNVKQASKEEYDQLVTVFNEHQADGAKHGIYTDTVQTNVKYKLVVIDEEPFLEVVSV